MPGRQLVGGRTYEVYLPKCYRRTRAPMVLLLHGCLQSPAEFADASRFTAVADRHGFILVLPRQQRRYHANRCWRWYESRNQYRGFGEPAALVDVVRAVLAERNRWRADADRVYVAGLSAGGAMALTLAATYPDLFAAAGAHSAPAFGSATHGGQALAAMAARTPIVPSLPGRGPITPLIVVQGGADEVVSPANADRITEQWLAAHARRAAPVSPGRTRAEKGSALGRDFTRVRYYRPRGTPVLEVWQVQGLAHAWSGGRKGGSYSDPLGPRAATLMWGFFRGRTRPAPPSRPRRRRTGGSAR